MGSPRQGRALAAAAAGQRVTHALAQRQPSPLGGTGVAVWGSADAEQFFFSRYYLGLRPLWGLLPESTLKVRRQGGLAATRAHRRQASIGNHHSNEAARTPPASPGGCSMEHPYKLHYQSTKQHLHPPPPRRATAPEQPPRVAGRMLHGASPQVPGYQSAQKKTPGAGLRDARPCPGWVWRKYDCLT